jgi:hypothetical protein
MLALEPVAIEEVITYLYCGFKPIIVVPKAFHLGFVVL